jgi:hypothetical protein
MIAQQPSCKIGDTNCCQRSMMNLNAAGVGDNFDTQAWTDVTLRIQDLAAWTCCGFPPLYQALKQPRLSLAQRHDRAL